MLALFSLFFVILMAGICGGLLYVLYEKKQTVKRLSDEVDALKAKQDEASRIIHNQTEIQDEARSIADTMIAEARSSADTMIAEARSSADSMTKKALEVVEKHNAAASAEQEKYKELYLQCARLQNQCSQAEKRLNEIMADEEVPFYKPHFHFEMTVEFERAINENRREQRELVRNGAIRVAGGNDKKLTSALSKLALRAFNAESLQAAESVDYKNIVTYEKRVQNAFDQINNIIEKFGIKLSTSLLELKIKELQLVYEHQEKRQADVDEQRRIREIMRDELRAERELEKAKEEADKEERRIRTLLERLQESTRNAEGAALEKMNAQVEELKRQLAAAEERQRKISQAQLTKAGHIYVISNIGSFGESVYKIGMTRRLEPMERIDELGDASVPFRFDVHAMIYSENAPELESILHQEFDSCRINKINLRKEFFRVDLARIEKVARQYKADVEFTYTAEAKEYRQSIAIKAAEASEDDLEKDRAKHA